MSIDENVTKLMDNKGELMKLIADSVHKGKEVYADQYIEGREFNISILGGKEGPQVLLPAEMCFYNYPEGKLKVVGYRTKWVEDSFEYENTRRTFDFPPDDAPLLELLKQICLKCWKAFNLKGYARVDFRVDKNNVPYVLEINANPCISPSSGFISAAKQTGISMKEVFERIIYDTYHKI
ncbi:MAG: D-alanine--D-alanine ligase B [Bacteroidetes bacterium ADurb.Bin408]|nr:MAG: D-alanine--D-alanine ligase B [Bacteroidetes bacterium ADurb.Bin408]